MNSRAWIVAVTAWRSQIFWRSAMYVLCSAACIRSHRAQLEHAGLKMAVSAAGVVYISLFSWTSTRSDHAVLCEAAPCRETRCAAPSLPASPPSAFGPQCSPGLLGSFRPSSPGFQQPGLAGR